MKVRPQSAYSRLLAFAKIVHAAHRSEKNLLSVWRDDVIAVDAALAELQRLMIFEEKIRRMTRYIVLTGLGIFIAIVIAGSIYGVLPEKAKWAVLCATHIAVKGDCP